MIYHMGMGSLGVMCFFFSRGLQSNVNELSANMYSKHSVYLSIKDTMKQILI